MQFPPAESGRPARPWMSAEQKRELLVRLGAARGRLDEILAMVEKDTASPEMMQEVGVVQATLERVNRILLLREVAECLGAATTTAEDWARASQALREFPLGLP